MSAAGTADVFAERRRRDAEEEREALRLTGDIASLRRMLRYLAPRKGAVVLACAIAVVTALLMLAPMLIVKVAIDDHIARKDMAGVWRMAILLFVSQALLVALEAFNSYLIARIGNESMRDLRMELFAKLQRQPLSFFHKNPIGRLVTRLTGDVNTLYELFSQGIVGVFQQVFFLLATIGLMFWTNWRLALWTMTIVPAVIYVSRDFRNRIRDTYALIRVRIARLNAFVQENLSGMRTVQAFTREHGQFDRYAELNGSARDANIKTVFAFAIYFPLIEVLCAVGFAIVVWRGGLDRLADSAAGAAALGAVTVGQLALFVQALERFFIPVRDLSEKYNLVLTAIASSDRVFKLLDREPEILDPPAPVDPGPLRTAIEFKNVRFAYKDEQWVLSGIDLRIARGETVAIVGHTGSGKSTLVSLLCRFHDVQQGSIEIDGVDVRRMTQEALRRKIAIVLQDVFLFFGTVTDNIRLGDRRIPEERVREVAEAVNAAPFIERLPKGYETNVRERGATLSTGQKQLIGLARALAFDPEILILDEATANIDSETERLIQAALAKVLEGRTALVIAHRLSTIQRADRIVVLHHGHIAEQGTHQELLARDGLYRKLYELQFKEEL